MGCSSSKLTGDEFNDIEATKSHQTMSKPSTSTMTQQEKANKETLPSTSEPNESKLPEDKVPLIEGRSDSITRYSYEVRARDVEIARTGGSNTGVSYAPTPSNP